MAYDPANLPEAPLHRLAALMAVLRSPQGCPWDRRQDHRSLRQYLLEETYEVLAVLDDPDGIDDADLADELGDLLLQVVFHAQLGAERGAFDLPEVARRVCERLVRRHPHVFGDIQVANAGEVVRNWERIKQEEGRAHLFDGIPDTLPALARADRALGRAERNGTPLLTSEETAGSLRLGMHILDATGGEQLDVEGVCGEFLLALVSRMRTAGVDAESALRGVLGRRLAEG